MHPDEYRKLALVEDQMWYFRALHGHCLRALTARLGSERTAAVLDAGCGTGGLIRHLAKTRPTWQLTGVDASDLACGLSKERTTASIVKADIENLPFEDGSFDAVVTADVLYHVESDVQALKEMRRVLKPGGAIVFNVPAYPWLWSYHDVAVESKRRYTKADLRIKFTQAGFGPISMSYWNTLLFPMIVVRRKLMPAPKGGSDVSTYFLPVDALFGGLTALESLWLRSGIGLPFGSSLFGSSER